MARERNEIVEVDEIPITVVKHKGEEYVSLTDMAGYKDKQESRAVIINWMSTHYTIDFLAIWEQVNNPDFKRMGLHTFKTSPGRLVVSPKRWIEETNARGIISRRGRS